MSEAGLTGIGKRRTSRYAMALWQLGQRVAFNRDPCALARRAAGGAVQRS